MGEPEDTELETGNEMTKDGDSGGGLEKRRRADPDGRVPYAQLVLHPHWTAASAHSLIGGMQKGKRRRGGG